MNAATDPTDEQLRVAGRRRIGRIRLFTMPFIAICAVGGGLLSATSHHDHRHHSAVGLAVGAAVGVLVTIGMVWVLYVCAKRLPDSKWNFVPLAAGLSRDERKRLRCDLRTGTPSETPLLRRAETELANRLVQRFRLGVGFFTAILLLEVVNVFLRNQSLPLKIFFLAAVLIFAGYFFAYLISLRRARRYLSALGDEAAPANATT